MRDGGRAHHIDALILSGSGVERQETRDGLP
jgi:hypothetical protein